jgi:PBP1b-binding outer membrane lipoprotein LpoB
MIKIISIIVFITLGINACSEEGNNQQQQDHVWKEQTETLDKAKAVEGILKDTVDTREQQLQDDSE